MTGTQELLRRLAQLNTVTYDTKFGRNESVGTSAELINDLSTTSYTYTSTATTYYISSSSGSDTDQTVVVSGIDENWAYQTVTVSLAGQTKTALSGSWLRVFRVYVSAGSSAAGDLYVYEDDTVTAGVPQTASKIRAKVLIGNNQILMAQLTVPDNYEMAVFDFMFTSGKDNNMFFQVKMRPADGSGPWRTIFAHDAYRSPIVKSRSIPYIIPEKTDIEVWATGGTGTSAAAVDWSYVWYPKTSA